jgi:hypothetical protein
LGVRVPVFDAGERISSLGPTRRRRRILAVRSS